MLSRELFKLQEANSSSLSCAKQKTPCLHGCGRLAVCFNRRSLGGGFRFWRTKGCESRVIGMKVTCCNASPWEALGVEPQADEQQIRRAYRKLALKHHPDLNSSPEAPRKFVAIHEAYEVLMGRRRGKEDPQRPQTKGWDFHDWYWNFMTGQRQKSKSGAAARSTTALRTDHLESQLEGLKRKAAARRVRVQHSAPATSWSTPAEAVQTAHATSSNTPAKAIEEQPAATTHSAFARAADELAPSEPAASMPGSAQPPSQYQDRQDEVDISSTGHSQPAAQKGEQLADRSMQRDGALHTSQLLHCVQEILSHAWRSDAVTFTVRSWPAQTSGGYTPQASAQPSGVADQTRCGVTATMEQPAPQTAAREAVTASCGGQADAVSDEQGAMQGVRGEDDDLHQQEQEHVVDESMAPPEVQSQLEGLKRRAAMRVRANV